MAQPISDEVRRFILTSVPSVPYLEAILLFRSAPDAAWDAPQLARRLYVPQAQAAEILAQLSQAGLVQQLPPAAAWRWGPDAELAALIDQVARVYAEDLLGVTELIHSRQERRARQFADAFRWRKDN